LFGPDGEYTAFASVAAGQFEPIKAHLRALRDVSEAVNGDSGKIVHEVTPDGAVYFGANADAGNTDESSKYPSAVALVWRWTGDRAFLKDLYPASVKAMRHVASLDADGDGWPGGLGNVERPGMGDEKLDNAVYTIRGYADLADMARARGDRTTRVWATKQARKLMARFEDLVVRQRCRVLRRFAGRPRQQESVPAALDRPDADRCRAAQTVRAALGTAGLTRACEPHPRPASGTLLHRGTRVIPHRNGTDVGAGRQSGGPLRLGGFGSPE
jgi:hypothetical protein